MPRLITKKLLIYIIAVVWIVAISYIMAHSEYYRFVDETFAFTYPNYQIEVLSELLIAILSFFPSGLLLAYAHVAGAFERHKTLRTLLLSFGIALACWFLFTFYQRAVLAST